MARVPWFELPDDYDPDASRPIAKSPMWFPCELTRVGPAQDGSGELVYLVNEGAVYSREDRVASYLRGTAARSARDTLTLCRLECKVPLNQGIYREETLVVSRFPHASGLVATAAFKGAFKKKKDEQLDPLWKPHADRNAAICTLDQWRYDYWETGNFLTAAISNMGKPLLREYYGGTSEFWLFGVCHDLNECVRTLWGHAQVARLLEQTERGTIRYAHPSAGSPPLKPETREMSVESMNMAILQALAGTADEQASDYLGTPVIRQVEKIYCKLLNNPNRRKSLQAGTIDLLATQWEDSAATPAEEPAVQGEDRGAAVSGPGPTGSR